MSNLDKLRQGQKVAETAAVLETILAVGKIVIGFMSGSIVLISDALHSTSDLLTIFISWFGLKMAQRDPDEKYPFGYYKAENLGTVIISIAIIFASWQMFSRGLGRLKDLESIAYLNFAIAISLIDALVLYFFGSYEIRQGQKINSQSLIALGRENRTHIFTSIAVLLGVLATHYQVPYVEGIITIGISFLILRIGIASIVEGGRSLMDVSPDNDLCKEVVLIGEGVSGVEEIYDLRLRRSGPFVLGTTKAGIKKEVSAEKAHEIADRIESEVKAKIPEVESFLVHVEPLVSEYRHLAIPVNENNGLRSSVADKFARAKYTLFVNLKKNKVVGSYCLDNLYKDKEVKAGLNLAKLIIKQRSGAVITKEIGEIADNVLKNNLVDIYLTNAKNAKSAVSDFLKKVKLKK
jgi:cation diffusion facilitator family transporter